MSSTGAITNGTAAKQTWVVVMWLLDIAAIALIGVVSMYVSNMADSITKVTEKTQALEVAMASVQSNRFTSADANVLMDRIMQLNAEMKTLPREVPPKWFIERVDRIERKLDVIEGRQDDHLKNFHGLRIPNKHKDNS